MDFTTSKLIALGYVLLVVVLSGFGYAIYRLQVATLPAPLEETDRETASRIVSGETEGRRRARLELARQKEAMTELQHQLSVTEELVRSQQKQIETQRHEHQRSREAADRYLEILAMVLNERTADRSVQDSLDRTDADSEIATDSQDPNAPSPDTVESLQTSLAAAQWELSTIRESAAEFESSALMEAERRIAITTALVDAGVLSVPALTDVLSHEDAAIRTWGVTTLGRIGPAAIDALEPLMRVAVQDGNAEVRAAAEAAVHEITGI